MKMTEEVTNNRDNLIMAIALVEDITRTNSRIYELLTSLMNNPQEITNIKTSIDSLYDKVGNLKNSDIGTPLIDEEKVVVPGPEDVSPEKDPDYKEPVQTPSEPKPEENVEENVEEEVEEPVEEPPQRMRRKPRRGTRKSQPDNTDGKRRNRRPMKKSRKLPREPRLPSPDIDSI